MMPSMRLTPFEQYMLADDRPSHPMAFVMRFILSGRLDEALLQSAIDRAVSRHPLLRSRVSQSQAGTWSWTESPDPRPYFDCAEAATPMRYPGHARIDLRRENGLRIWARNGDGSAELRFQFHHACCDGIGAYQFIEDVLCSYDQAVTKSEDNGRLRPLVEGSRTKGISFRSNGLSAVKHIAQQLWGLAAGTATFACGRPAPLCSPDPAVEYPTENQPLLDWPAHTYTRAESQRLRDIASGCGASLNDLLLRDLFLAFRAWNVRHDGRTRRRRIRIMIPTSLRDPDDEPGPAANVVSMVYIGRGAWAERDPRRMLRGIRRETRFLYGWRLSLAFLRGCQIARAVPGAMSLLCNKNKCYATSVLSSMGRVLAQAPLRRMDQKFLVGDLTLEGVELAPALRPHTSAGLISLIYAGRLSLIMSYDPQRFRQSTACELKDTIVQQTRKTLETGT